MTTITEQNYLNDKIDMQFSDSSPIKISASRKSNFPVITESVKGIAHDMRNFLSAISGYLELIKMEPGKNELINNALKAVDLAAELNLRLLKPQQQKPIRVNIASVIEKTATAIIGSSKIKFSLLMSPDLDDLFIDELLLERALQNILMNSIQAMSDGGTINISTCNIDQGNLVVPTLSDQKYIQISIKDDGSGIPEQYINMIMEPFFSTKTTGSGLGLAITKEIISSLKGTIEVASSDGFGTMIVIYLPVENK